jgi:GNAT superfamily N-acetyltransferase
MGKTGFTRAEVEGLAWRLLERSPNAVPRFRLLRDVLCLPPGDPELEEARRILHAHAWVEALADEQLPDGSWGRFHSMNSRLKRRFPTSETAISRALALGLEKNHPLLKSAANYMLRVLQGEIQWTDRVERSESWLTAVEAITAGTLARLDPDLPALDSAWEYWVGIADEALSGSSTNRRVELQAHLRRRGVGSHYLASRYVLQLLGSRGTQLPADLARRILNWLWESPAGIGYLGADLRQSDNFHIFNWVESLEILSGFPGWHNTSVGAMDWLWVRHNPAGLWDFGPRISRSFYFPLSDSHRRAGSRLVDHSTRVLALLRKVKDI